MTYSQRPDELRRNAPAHNGDGTIGSALGNVAEDFSRLVRQELELAKVEVREEAAAAGRAGAMFGIAMVAALMIVVLLSFGLVYALAEVMPPGWAALIVAIIWAVVGGISYAVGRQRMRAVKVVPEKSVQSVKEDMRWLRNPTG